MLLNRYGASSMDELYVMILLGRTNEALGWWESKVNTLPSRVVAAFFEWEKKHPGLSEFIIKEQREAEAKERYRRDTNQRIAQRRTERRRAELSREMMTNSR